MRVIKKLSGKLLKVIIDQIPFLLCCQGDISRIQSEGGMSEYVCLYVVVGGSLSYAYLVAAPVAGFLLSTSTARATHSSEGRAAEERGVPFSHHICALVEGSTNLCNAVENSTQNTREKKAKAKKKYPNKTAVVGRAQKTFFTGKNSFS